MKRAIITGASSGLGAAISFSLHHSLNTGNCKWNITNWSLETAVDVSNANSVRNAAAIWSTQNENRGANLDVFINCAGVNGIDFLDNVTEADWDRIMNTNAKGIFLTTRALLPYLKGGTILNIVSNASHVPMTSSLAYNASKGAAAIMTKQLSRELIKTHGITVFAISPNKLANTGMSRQIDNEVVRTRGWTLEEAKKYQVAALPAGEETNPETLAEFIAFLLSTKERHKYLAGCDIPYGL